MSPAPFTAADDYEQRIGQETYHKLTTAIEERTLAEQARLRELSENLSAAERASEARIKQAEADAQTAITKLRQDSLRTNGIAWTVVLGFLVASSVVTLSAAGVIGIFLLALIAGALVYIRRLGGAAGVAVVGFIAAIVAAYFINGTSLYGGTNYTPNPLWGLYAILLLLLLGSVMAAFYVLRLSKEKEKRETVRVAQLRSVSQGQAEALRTDVALKVGASQDQLRTLHSVIPLWRAGGPDAERAASILVANGMTEEAGLLRAHQRKLNQIRYQDREVSNRAEILRQAQEAMHSATVCPRCGAPRTGQAGNEGTVRCEYCGVVYKPLDVHRFA